VRWPQNWEAEPLDSYEKALKFIRTTKTKTGLRVTARLDRTNYPTGVKVSFCRMLLELTCRVVKAKD
jgi:hypothetical protein